MPVFFFFFLTYMYLFLFDFDLGWDVFGFLGILVYGRTLLLL